MAITYGIDFTQSYGVCNETCKRLWGKELPFKLWLVLGAQVAS